MTSEKGAKVEFSDVELQVLADVLRFNRLPFSPSGEAMQNALYERIVAEINRRQVYG